VVRTHSEEERVYLERSGAGMVVMGERELARTMARHALDVAGPAAL
jgi:CPA2 family monovalent cation:H+ antiporter-2